MECDNISLRIKELVNHFCGGNNSKFAELTNTSEANIRNYISGTKPKFDFIAEIASKFEINYEWLLIGKGDMLSKSNVPISIKEIHKKSTPVYDIAVSAGTLGLIATENSIIEPTGYCDLEMFIGCEAILPVVGMSMNPIISPGDFIGVKRIILKNDDLSFLRTGYIYLIITREDRMIKFIEQCDDANYIICKSPNYAPFKVLKDDILELHLVKAVSKSLM